MPNLLARDVVNVLRTHVKELDKKLEALLNVNPPEACAACVDPAHPPDMQAHALGSAPLIAALASQQSASQAPSAEMRFIERRPLQPPFSGILRSLTEHEDNWQRQARAFRFLMWIANRQEETHPPNPIQSALKFAEYHFKWAEFNKSGRTVRNEPPALEDVLCCIEHWMSQANYSLIESIKAEANAKAREELGLPVISPPNVIVSEDSEL
jgi:hypothetical protein